MKAPRLPEVEQVADELAGAICSTDPSTDSLWHVSGPPTAGKSALLHGLSVRLRDRGLWPIMVDPPAGHLDAGPAALVDIGRGLQSYQRLDGGMHTLIQPERPWADKLLTVRGWMGEHRERVVLLCDEPIDWPARAEADSHFAARTRDVVTLLLQGVECRRVVVGRLPSAYKTLRSSGLKRVSDPEDWLADADEWGALAEAAKVLLADIGGKLTSYSPLEIRLLVALAAVTSSAEVAGWLLQAESRRAISRQFADHISRHSELEPLCELWGKLALVRRPFDESLLQTLGADTLNPLASDILRRCLLYTQGGNFILHDTLRADARDQGWLDQDSARKVHGQLAAYYRARFARLDAPATALHEALLDEMEAYHHATMSGDWPLVSNLRPFFVLQLDILGRVLSYELRKYDSAGQVFERAIRWDPGDDYGHHYLAYNLDIQGKDARRVEEHYRQAIDLNPDHPWWRSRWITFLITRGRIADARRAWDDALDALGLPDANADPSVYENLHLWVARILLHRGHLDFARRVLDGIPGSVRDAHPGLRAIERRLAALLEAHQKGAFAPGPFLGSRWWIEGPYLLPRRLKSNRKLVEWLAGRVDEVRDDAMHLRVARVVAGSTREPEFYRMSVKRAQFDEWLSDEKASRLEAGRFVEIGTYAKDRGAAEIYARVHPSREWYDEDLPPLLPDPARYLHGLAKTR